MSLKASHFKGVYTYGGLFYIPLGKPVSSAQFSSLKCLYINAHSMGSKHEELVVCVQLQGHGFIAVMETWWDSSNAVVDG